MYQVCLQRTICLQHNALHSEPAAGAAVPRHDASSEDEKKGVWHENRVHCTTCQVNERYRTKPFRIGEKGECDLYKKNVECEKNRFFLFFFALAVGYVSVSDCRQPNEQISNSFRNRAKLSMFALGPVYASTHMRFYQANGCRVSALAISVPCTHLRSPANDELCAAVI